MYICTFHFSPKNIKNGINLRKKVFTFLLRKSGLSNENLRLYIKYKIKEEIFNLHIHATFTFNTYVK